ncbi:MAG: hypothetical protein JXR91_02420 [Deltaproteobacteria bacterium]|nr:hypothetical protein [Deltaproteobacteria bacterium]
MKLNTSITFMIFALVTLFYFVSCTGTDTDSVYIPPSGDTDTDTDTDSDSDADGDFISGEPIICDGVNDCYGDCWGCAESHLCSNSLKACEDDFDCSTLKDCIGICDNGAESEWDSCYDNCVGGDVVAENLLLSFWGCIHCGACKNDCSGEGFDECSTLTAADTSTISDDGLTYNKANLSWYESYPDPGSDECINYNGCDYLGYFVYTGNTQQSEAWVAANNIIAVHSDDYSSYAGKTFRIRQGANTIDAKVYDMCKDSDCDGCCSQNRAPTGFLIDMEIYTFSRFGGETGVVEWTCLDCGK